MATKKKQESTLTPESYFEENKITATPTEFHRVVEGVVTAIPGYFTSVLLPCGKPVTLEENGSPITKNFVATDNLVEFLKTL